MLRLKLWAFYQLMAWNSLIRPSDGQEMIEVAQVGKAKQDHDKSIQAIMGLAQVAKRDGIDWSKAPKWADRHVWDYQGVGWWLGYRANDWLNSYPLWECEDCKSGIDKPDGTYIDIEQMYVRRPTNG